MKWWINRMAVWLLVGTVLAAAGTADARAKKKSPAEYEFLVQYTYTDNIFREEESRGKTSDAFTTLRFEVEKPFRLEGGNRLTPFADLRQVLYRNTDEADYFHGEAGVEWRFAGNRISLSYGHSPERLLFINFMDETVDYEVDSWMLRGRRNLGERVRLDLSFRQSDDNYEPQFSGRTNTEDQYRGSLAFRVNEKFNPGIGFTHDEADAEDDNHDRRRDRYEFFAEGKLAEKFIYLLRVRYRESEYLGTDPSGSNFGREDERQEFFLELQVPMREKWRLRLGAYYVNADSTRPDRNFDAYEWFATGLWRF